MIYTIFEVREFISGLKNGIRVKLTPKIQYGELKCVKYSVQKVYVEIKIIPLCFSAQFDFMVDMAS